MFFKVQTRVDDPQHFWWILRINGVSQGGLFVHLQRQGAALEGLIKLLLQSLQRGAFFWQIHLEPLMAIQDFKMLD